MTKSGASGASAAAAAGPPRRTVSMRMTFTDPPRRSDDDADSSISRARSADAHEHRLRSLDDARGRRDRARDRLVRLGSEEHTSALQSRQYLVCRLLLEKKKQKP